MTVVTNTTNVGFPAAINQGLRLARGEYLVLLNNDVVVTDGWLDQLIALVNAKRGDVNGSVETSSPHSVGIVPGFAESTPPDPPSRSGGTTLGQGCSPSVASADGVLPVVPPAEIPPVSRGCAAHPPWPPLHKGGKGAGSSTC